MLVTVVCENRVRHFEDPALAREAIEALYRVQDIYPFFLYGFVVMPDHCHFLLYIPSPGSISKIMNVYKSGLTFNIGIKRLWQSSFHIRLIENRLLALTYIHMNPVKAGYVEFPELYPWSSASGKWDVNSIDIP